MDSFADHRRAFQSFNWLTVISHDHLGEYVLIKSESNDDYSDLGTVSNGIYRSQHRLKEDR